MDAMIIDFKTRSVQEEKVPRPPGAQASAAVVPIQLILFLSNTYPAHGWYIFRIIDGDGQRDALVGEQEVGRWVHAEFNRARRLSIPIDYLNHTANPAFNYTVPLLPPPA